MPSLRSSIRTRLEAEEAEQVEQNPIEAAAKQAIEERLAEHPEQVRVEPKPEQQEQPEPMRRWAEEHPTYFSAGSAEDLEMRAADIRARNEGYAFGSREYIDSIENKLGLREKQEDTPPQPRPMPRRERGPVMAAPVSREPASWSSGRSAPSKTELTGEEIALAHSLGISPEEYRANKAKMNQLKASGVIQT